jgi:hypothetical protein
LSNNFDLSENLKNKSLENWHTYLKKVELIFNNYIFSA